MREPNTNDQPRAPVSVGGKIFATLFGLFFMAIPLLFSWLIVRDVMGGAQAWTWRKTACEITASDVGQTNQTARQMGDYYFKVRYRYSFEGRQISAEQYAPRPEISENYTKIARLTERYAPGSSAFCYVNPAAPAQAVLARPNLFVLLVVVFPMSFAGLGAIIIYAAWRPMPVRAAEPPSISGRPAPAKSLWFKICFCSVFLLGGAAAFYGFFVRPVLQVQRAKTWPAVPAVVISSEVKRHRGRNGRNPTYNINIFYRYEFNGRGFKANTYDFMGGSSSGSAAKQAVVARNPPGTKTVCYVNPGDPEDAVLERGFTSEMWIGLIPLLIMMAGAGGLVFVVRQSRKNAFAGAPSPALSAVKPT